MKKLASLLISIILLVFINTLAHAGWAKFDDNDVDLQTSGYEYIEAVLLNEAIATSSTKTVNIYNIAGYGTFAIHNVSASSGNPTFEFQSLDQTGSIVSTAAMTAGTDITNIDGSDCQIVITNAVAIPITITASILIAD